MVKGTVRLINSTTYGKEINGVGRRKSGSCIIEDKGVGHYGYHLFTYFRWD